MHLIVAAIVGALLGLYFYKRKSPLTVKEWFLGLFIILVAVVITDGIIHIDAIIEGFQKVLTIPTVFDKELNDS
ncbi:hypothetical protein J4711_13340 [Staphylococcus epidermidis]|nr:hypothetical protein [Staphylococcus epidermidis]MBO1925678.1 hypothetical protein [Staphylococcus epidermidis]